MKLDLRTAARKLRRQAKAAATDAFTAGSICGVGVSVIVFEPPTTVNLAGGAVCIALACVMHGFGTSRTSRA